MSPRKKKEEQSMGGSIDALYKHLKSDDEHYSFSEAIDYRVSSGSLNLDLQMGGGLNPESMFLAVLLVEGKHLVH